MLKRLAILTLAVASGHISAQIPGQRGQQENKTKQEQHTSGPGLPPAIIQEGNRDEQAQRSQGHSHDWKEAIAPSTWSNWALFLAAVLAAFFAWRTLRAIGRQADQMEAQLVEMEKVSEIENKTLILQYRPRVIVRNTVAKEFTAGGSEQAICRLAFQVANIGGSPANITGGEIYMLAVSLHGEDDIRFIESTHGIVEQRTLQPGERENFEDVLESNIPTDAGWSDFHESRASIHSIYLIGTIWYRDDLSILRQTGIHRKYDPKSRRFESDQTSEQEYSD
jgi:hypothetical protein